jgi:hypothetical protein
MRRLPLLLPMLLAATPLLPGQASGPGAGGTPPGPVLPETAVSSNGQYWKVGVASFEATALDPESLYLTHSIPLMLLERMEEVSSHHFSERERQAHRQQLLQGERRRLAETLAGLRRERDELFFSPGGRARVEGYDERIQGIVQQLADLKGEPPESIEFPASMPVRFSYEAEGGLLIEQPIRSPLQAARQAGVDLLVFGRLEQIQDYLFLEVRALDAALEEEVFSYTDTASPTEIYGIVEDVAQSLKGTVWGSEWAALAVDSEPAGASVWVDDRYLGRTPLHVPYLLPGRRELRVQAEGYQESRLTLTLEAQQLHSERVVLAARPAELLSLESQPPGASVYDGARWLGNTPVELPRPEGAARLLLRKEGYRDYPLYVDADTPKPVKVTLLPEAIDPLAEQQARRNGFYTAFGLFALSVPFPLFFWGYAGDNYVKYFGGAGDDAAQKFRKDLFGYAGTLALSAVLFTNMLAELLRYIEAGDRRG